MLSIQGCEYDDTFIVRPARVWVVDPTRGDLYVILLAGTTKSFFVRLLKGGIVNNPSTVINKVMLVRCNIDGEVVALPDQLDGTWHECKPVGTP